MLYVFIYFVHSFCKLFVFSSARNEEEFGIGENATPNSMKNIFTIKCETLLPAPHRTATTTSRHSVEIKTAYHFESHKDRKQFVIKMMLGVFGAAKIKWKFTTLRARDLCSYKCCVYLRSECDGNLQ